MGCVLSPPRIDDAELRRTQEAMIAHGNNQTAAAKSLGLSRSALQNRLSMIDARGMPLSDAGQEKHSDEIIQLRERLRIAEGMVKSMRQETISEQYIKQKIIGLAAEKPRIPAWLINTAQASSSPGVPTLFASDWHFGEVVDPAQIGGVNDYNLMIAHERARRLIHNAIDLLTNHMVNPEYPGIVFALGGDMVSGDIHEELSATNDAEIMPSVLDLWGVLVWCIETLAERFGRVFVPCVSGNHGRNTHKIRAKGRNFTSFDWLVYQFLAKHFEKDKRVTVHVPDGPDAYYVVAGHRYLLTHGDQFRGGDGMIGALGPVIRGDHKKRSRNAQIDRAYDTLLIGHWHQLIQTRRLIMNGSLVGYSEYAYAGNFGFEPPQQALWITHPTRGITFQMNVYVDDPDIKPETEWCRWAS